MPVAKAHTQRLVIRSFLDCTSESTWMPLPLSIYHLRDLSRSLQSLCTHSQADAKSGLFSWEASQQVKQLHTARLFGAPKQWQMSNWSALCAKYQLTCEWIPFQSRSRIKPAWSKAKWLIHKNVLFSCFDPFGSMSLADLKMSYVIQTPSWEAVKVRSYESADFDTTIHI